MPYWLDSGPIERLRGANFSGSTERDLPFHHKLAKLIRFWFKGVPCSRLSGSGRPYFSYTKVYLVVYDYESQNRASSLLVGPHPESTIRPNYRYISEKKAWWRIKFPHQPIYGISWVLWYVIPWVCNAVGIQFRGLIRNDGNRLTPESSLDVLCIAPAHTPVSDCKFGNNSFTEMCSGSEVGSSSRLIDFCFDQRIDSSAVSRKASRCCPLPILPSPPSPLAPTLNSDPSRAEIRVLSDRRCLSMSFKKSTSLQNRQLVICYYQFKC